MTLQECYEKAGGFPFLVMWGSAKHFIICKSINRPIDGFEHIRKNNTGHWFSNDASGFILLDYFEPSEQSTSSALRASSESSPPGLTPSEPPCHCSLGHMGIHVDCDWVSWNHQQRGVL